MSSLRAVPIDDPRPTPPSAHPSTSPPTLTLVGAEPGPTARTTAMPDPLPSPPPPLAVAGRHVYLIGIGGSGMSGMARMLAARGAIVRGSDASQSGVTDALVRDGLPVDLDLAPGLPDECDLVVASAAIRPDHPQILAAQHRGIETLAYAEALGRCMIGRTGVCIAGTHGKSTTTAMLGCILQDAGLDPTVIVGATCRQLGASPGAPPAAGGAGFRLGREAVPAGRLAGRPGFLVAESCEFNRSFHNYRPVVAAITSVEADHLDIYGSLDAVVESFSHFARLIAPAAEGGLLLIAHDGAHRREVTAGVSCSVETIGFSPAADWVVAYDPRTRRVELRNPPRTNGTVVAAWTCNLPGDHNAMNGATAAALALTLGAERDAVERSLSGFRGVDRRCQMLGERPLVSGGSVRVYDDYGHHPTEVEATLRALRQFEAPEKRGGRLICVFQPHQHSRTRHLLAEFAAAFDHADVVIVPHIYFVRDSEEEKHKVTAGDLVDRLREKGVHAMHLYPFEAIIEQLAHLCRGGDLLVVMGAGPVNQVAEGFLARA
ncbi:MAG: UDP-N-acetylmuramate--L-alanine ligase [Phycisphaerales bacterium]